MGRVIGDIPSPHALKAWGKKVWKGEGELQVRRMAKDLFFFLQVVRQREFLIMERKHGKMGVCCWMCDIPWQAAGWERLAVMKEAGFGVLEFLLTCGALQHSGLLVINVEVFWWWILVITHRWNGLSLE